MCLACDGGRCMYAWPRKSRFYINCCDQHLRSPCIHENISLKYPVRQEKSHDLILVFNFYWQISELSSFIVSVKFLGWNMWLLLEWLYPDCLQAMMIDKKCHLVSQVMGYIIYSPSYCAGNKVSQTTVLNQSDFTIEPLRNNKTLTDLACSVKNQRTSITGVSNSLLEMLKTVAYVYISGWSTIVYGCERGCLWCIKWSRLVSRVTATGQHVVTAQWSWWWCTKSITQIIWEQTMEQRTFPRSNFSPNNWWASC